MIHYSLHADIDPRHAQEFFELIDDTKSEDFINATEGMRMGLIFLTSSTEIFR